MGIGMVAPQQRARAAGTTLEFNGSDRLFDHLESVEYTDPAAGESDELKVNLFNVDLIWLKDKAPKLGDFISGALVLTNWNGAGDNKTLKYGSFLVDDVDYNGGPSSCTIACVSKPADSSWSTRPRTQVWEDVTVAAIAGELGGRYGLALNYQAPTINITKIEQSQQTDQAFLEDLVEDHDLGMKVFEHKLVIFDWGQMEGQGPVATITRSDFVGDNYNYHETLAGVYTGAEIAYKNGDNDEEIKLQVGDAKRQIFISQTADTAAEADKIARSEVNKSNRDMAIFTVDLWPRDDITSGVCVQLDDMGIASGKYFVDKMTVKMDAGSGTKFSIEAHKCQPRI